MAAPRWRPRNPHSGGQPPRDKAADANGNVSGRRSNNAASKALQRHSSNAAWVVLESRLVVRESRWRSFYAHFRDKDDLLVSGAEEIRESLRQLMAAFIARPARETDGGMGVTGILFEHAEAHRSLYPALIGKRGGGVLFSHAHQDLSALFREHFDEAIAVRGIQPAVPVEVVVQFLVSALLSLVAWWLDNDLPYSAEEMNRMFQQLMRSGVMGILHESSPNVRRAAGASFARGAHER